MPEILLLKAHRSLYLSVGKLPSVGRDYQLIVIAVKTVNNRYAPTRVFVNRDIYT